MERTRFCPSAAALAALRLRITPEWAWLRPRLSAIFRGPRRPGPEPGGAGLLAKAILSCLAAAAILSAPVHAYAAPATAQRVMSLSQCGDQLVLMLLGADRIASVSYLAERGAAFPTLAAKAHGLPVNHGLAEEILAQKPDLIVAGAFTSGVARRLAKQSGIPVIELAPADTFQDIRDQMRTLGAALGESDRAEAWIARMDATLIRLARTAPRRPIVAVGWNGAGRVSSGRSLFNSILSAAGGYNVAAGDGAFERSLDLEELLALRPQPDVLLYEDAGRGEIGPRVDQAQHPALLRAYGRRRIAYPANAFTCGTPYAADAAVALRRGMLEAMTTARPRP